MPLTAAQKIILFNRPYSQKLLNLFGSSIVSYLPLSEPSGSVAYDIGGRGLNGAYTAVTLGVPGIGDGRTAGLFVPASSSRVNWYSAGLASAFNPLAGTLMLWLKVSGAGVWTDATIRYAGLLRADGSNAAYILKNSTDNAIIASYTAGGTNKSVTITTSSLAFIHLALTWDVAADQVKVYLNGAQQGTTQTGLGTWAGALAATTCNLGCLISGNSHTDGTLAHGLALNRAATAAEIAIAATVP